MSGTPPPLLSDIERLLDVLALPIGRWNREVRLVYCNPPYQRWADRARESLIGHRLVDLFGEPAWAAARDAIEQAFTGQISSYERQLTHAAFGGRWARIQVFPDVNTEGEVDTVLTIATDIHDDVVAREALVTARRRLDRLTENIPYPLTYLDRHCVLQFVNKAYADIIGRPAEEIIGRHIGELRGARRWEEHLPYFERALSGKTVHYSRLVDSLPQGPRWMRTSYVPDIEHGQVVGLYTVTMDVHDLTVAQEQLRRSVEHDALTDVLSRRAMMSRIESAVETAVQTPVALFFVDLDGFKNINDQLGHGEGDTLLVRVAAALQASVRTEDAVGRFGGDEFLVLANLPTAAAAQSLAQHMLAAILQASNNTVSASIGFALAPQDALYAMELLNAADDAMYMAKRMGKNRVIHCSSEPDMERE